MAQVLDGKALSKRIRGEIKERVSPLKEAGKSPCLAVILVGDDPASQVYVGGKVKACQSVGIESFLIQREESLSQSELLEIIDKLNRDSRVNGILVQLPLPNHINSLAILESVDPAKDVDGLHPLTQGRLLQGYETFLSCTPAGILKLLKEYSIKVAGKNVVILGRSSIVGKPLANLMLRENGTVTVCHSYTKNISYYTREADILITAVGKRGVISGSMVKRESVVIDVGINRVDGRLWGDVDFEQVEKVASYITPVPGGVGPMTITSLLENTFKAFKQQNSL